MSVDYSDEREYELSLAVLTLEAKQGMQAR